MAIVRRGHMAVATASTSSSSLTLPTGLEDGDVGILTCTYNPVGVPTSPSGWDLVSTLQYSASMEARIYTRTLGASDSGTLVPLAWPGPAKTAWQVAVYGGVEPLPPDAFGGLLSVGATTNQPNANATSTKPVVTLSFWHERSSAPSSTLVAPAGMTLVGAGFGTGGGACSIGAAENLSPTAGAGTVGGGTWTQNVSNQGVITFTVGLAALNATTVTGGPATLEVQAHEGVAAGTDGPVVQGKAAPLTLTSYRDLLGPVSNDVVGTTTYPAYAAHRGGAATHPQGTLRAYLANVVGRPGIAAEMDVRLNADGSLVLYHDQDYNGTPVASMTDAQWAAAEIAWPPGYSGPATYGAFWREIVAMFRGTGTLILPEVKQSSGLHELIASVVANSMQRQVIVQSFNLADLPPVVAAGIEALHLTNTPNWSSLLAAGVKHVGVEMGSVTSVLVANAHANGLKVWTYTPNNTAARDNLLAMGVDGFFTNRPGLLAPGGIGSEDPAQISVETVAGIVSGGATGEPETEAVISFAAHAGVVYASDSSGPRDITVTAELVPRWEAKVMKNIEGIVAGSVDYLDVLVIADVTITSQPVQIGVGKSAADAQWYPAVWQDSPSQRRIARIVLSTVGLNPNNNPHRVYLRVTDTSEAPLRLAGTLNLVH